MVTKKNKATKKRAKTLTGKQLARRFEGRQALIPGVKPRKKPAILRTYHVTGVNGQVREVPMPEEVRTVNGYEYRARPHSFVRTYTARMELRITPEQAQAWDRMAAAAQLTRAEWIRQRCDAAVSS